MNYAKILKADIANGTGFRVSLFVSGCGRKCPGCFNQIAQDPNYGKPFDEADVIGVSSMLETTKADDAKKIGKFGFSVKKK